MAHTSLGIRNYVRRLSSFAASALEANLRDLDLPYRLFLYVTDACNCRCNMCSIWQKPTDHELETQELLQVLANARHHVKWMDVTGGEIFLRPDVLELFSYIAQEMPGLLMFHFATNGLLTDRIVDAARIIARSDIPHFIVTVSLDGPEALHTRIRGVPGIWPKCMETFRQLRALRVPVVFGMTLTEHNHDRYLETVDAVAKEIPGIRHDDFHVNIAHISDLYYGNRGLIDPPSALLLESAQAIHALRSKGIGPVNLLERSYLKHASSYLETGRSPMLCEALSSSAVLGTRGDLFPCIIFDKPVGNVREHGYSIARLWRTKQREAIREEIRQGKCPQCWTPCEAYQSIIANTLPLGKNRRDPPPFLVPAAPLAGPVPAAPEPIR
jgi:MoaA/NifB/PqqE/SkfB family radical SAM enzyme